MDIFKIIDILMYFRMPQYKEFQVQGLWGLVQLSWQTFFQGIKKFTYPHHLGVITHQSSNTRASVWSSIDIMIQRPVGLISRGLCKILLWVCSYKRQGRHCTYNTLWHICVSTFAIEIEQFVSFVLLLYICTVNSAVDIESIATKTQQCILFIVALCILLQTIWNLSVSFI